MLRQEERTGEKTDENRKKQREKKSCMEKKG